MSSFNRWYDETWGFNYQDRLYATALLSFRDLDRAVTLTDEVLGRGARVVLLPTGPAYGRSPGDPYFDPVWAGSTKPAPWSRCTSCRSGTSTRSRPAWGHDPDPTSGACRRGSG